MSKIRSIRARIGTSGGAASKDDPPGAVEQPANMPPVSEACSSPRRPMRPLSPTLVLSSLAEGAKTSRPSDDAEVLELPGIGLIDVLGEQHAALYQRRPVAVLADHRPEIGFADLEVAREIHLIGLDDAALGILQRPDDARQHRRADLDRGRVVVGRELARLMDVELRAVTVGGPPVG